MIKRIANHEAHEALCAAFRKLEIKRHETANAMSYDHLIPAISRQLMLMRTPQAAIGAKHMRRKVGKAAAALRDLPPTALSDLAALGCPDVGKLTSRLMILEARGGRSGRPMMTEAKEIAEVVGEHYHALTGEKPTRRVDEANSKAYGPF
ncbi:MAG TPA: hypothetical protein VLX85_10570, partial [Stellaceae bacterium]|nr:hypothetical protein [Stellaceae bacterium]